MITVNGKPYTVSGIETSACTYFGLSTDEKPTSGVGNGSVFLEMNTAKIYLFDAANAQWIEWEA